MIVRAQPATTEGIRENGEQMTKMADRYNDLLMISSPEQRQREHEEKADETWKALRGGSVVGIGDKGTQELKRESPLKINYEAVHKRMQKVADSKKANGGKWRLTKK